jgi:hypothetical protein
MLTSLLGAPEGALEAASDREGEEAAGSASASSGGGSSSSSPMEGGFSYWVGVSFCVNYIMGCGFLAIPYNFVHTGVLLGPLVILVFALIMNISKDYMLEAMGRLAQWLRCALRMPPLPLHLLTPPRSPLH